MLIAALLLPAGGVFAEKPDTSKLTLNAALMSAYEKNPDLEAARASLRAVDETYAQATAGFKPAVTGKADYTSNYGEFSTGTAKSDPKTLSLEVTQSLYSGGSTVANVSSSYNKIKAERASLKVAEQAVLLDAVKAYMNYIRDQGVLELNVKNESVLKSHLEASRERFKLGDITRTDVSQAESRLAKATAGRIAAEGDLKKTRAFFEQVIGLSPLDLQKPAWTVSMPASEEAALDLALRNNPAIVAARYSEDAARDSTRSIEGENLPQISLTGTVSKIYDPTSVATDEEDTRSVGVRATLPLYSGGSTTSKIRQSRQTENQLHMKTRSAERAVRQEVIEAWEGFTAAVAESRALQTQTDAAKLALDGVTVESEFGARTTLNLLDAEQEYLDAQVAHVSAETDRIIAAYGILAAVGNLTAEGLHLKLSPYDPVKNFQNVNNVGSSTDTAIFRGDFKKIR